MPDFYLNVKEQAAWTVTYYFFVKMTGHKIVLLAETEQNKMNQKVKSETSQWVKKSQNTWCSVSGIQEISCF